MGVRMQLVDAPPDTSLYGERKVGGQLTDPDAGGDVEWLDGNAIIGYAVSFRGCVTGTVAQLDTGGSFSVDADIATDGQGRAVAAGTGDTIVARALEGSSGSGDEAWCVFVSRRTA